MPPSLQLEIDVAPHNASLNPPLAWDLYDTIPPFVGERLREEDATDKLRIALAQDVGYALALSEASNARHHAVLVGVAFMRILVTGPNCVAVELQGWRESPGSVVGIKDLLSTVRFSHMPHRLVDEEGDVLEENVQLYIDLITHAICSTPISKAEPLTKVELNTQSLPLNEAATSFAVGASDRLQVAGSARSELASTASSMDTEQEARPRKRRRAQTPFGLDSGSQSGDRRDPDGKGGSGGGGSAGGGFGASKTGTQDRRSQAQARERKHGGGPDMGSSQSHASTDQYLLKTSLGPNPIDIGSQLLAEDTAATNAINDSLRLGEEAATFVQSAAGEDEDGAQMVEELWALMEDGEPKKVKSWLAEHPPFTIMLYVEALERTQCQVRVVNPDEMSQLVASLHAEDRSQLRPSPQTSRPGVGFLGSTASPPGLARSPSTHSPSPLPTTAVGTIPLAPLLDERQESGATQETLKNSGETPSHDDVPPHISP